ncbi:Transcription antitermination factor NusG [Parapedobacter luteus]|uniref:Transcription antitermination factor NusG n=2 Tax=Sphingobacteriaceae TaxID=84566 RepID=A0A1T5A773_9SPHI|nr:Transcription antitermination factor NusG [Parapedobacter luteus]
MNSRNWMVIYTRSKWEKKVATMLDNQHITTFCPLIKRRRKWADRQTVVELPLFNSYVFVYANFHEQLKVLQTAGVVCFVTHNGKPAVVPQLIIEQVRQSVNLYDDIEAVRLEELKIGDIISINEGALNNLKGEIVGVEGGKVLVIIKQLNCALVAKVKVPYEQLTVLQGVSTTR